MVTAESPTFLVTPHGIMPGTNILCGSARRYLYAISRPWATEEELCGRCAVIGAITALSGLSQQVAVKYQSIEPGVEVYKDENCSVCYGVMQG